MFSFASSLPLFRKNIAGEANILLFRTTINICCGSVKQKNVFASRIKHFANFASETCQLAILKTMLTSCYVV